MKAKPMIRVTATQHVTHKDIKGTRIFSFLGGGRSIMFEKPITADTIEELKAVRENIDYIINQATVLVDNQIVYKQEDIQAE